jgi:hypothetical protein
MTRVISAFLDGVFVSLEIARHALEQNIRFERARRYQ